MALNVDQPFPTAAQTRVATAAKRQESRAFKRHSLENSVRRVFICSNAACQVTVDVHGRVAHEWQQRLWPCMKCGQGGDPPPLLFQNPMSGICYTESQWREYLDKVCK